MKFGISATMLVAGALGSLAAAVPCATEFVANQLVTLVPLTFALTFIVEIISCKTEMITSIALVIPLIIMFFFLSW